MLLEIEAPRLEVEFETPHVEDAVGEDQVPEQPQGIGNQLDDEGREGDARVSERQQHVDGGSDCAQRHADCPCPYRVDGHIDVEVSDRGSYLDEKAMLEYTCVPPHNLVHCSSLP